MAMTGRSARLFLGVLLLACGMTAFAAEPGSLSFTQKGHVSCGDIFSVPEGTIELWVKPTTVNNNEWLVGLLKDKDKQMVMGFGPADLMYMVKKDGEWAYAAAKKTNLQTGKWHHVACTFKTNTATMFLDGVGHKFYRTGNSSSLEHLAGGEFVIGKGWGKEYLNGLVAEVRLSNSIRYTNNFAPPTRPFSADANTVALWHFAEQGEMVSDASGNGHHGKIVGTVGHTTETPFTAGGAE